MNKDYISVSDINRYLKTEFDNNPILRNVYLKGEISNFKYHSRGHLYFSLKDENSKINAVMFSYSAGKLLFTPKDGDGVLVKGKISVYEATGGYQIYVDEMIQDGVGNLHIEFEKLKEKLYKEGLFDKSHKKPMPRIPKRVGVVTAPTGAVIRDIISTLNRRFPLVEVYLFPSLVQGDGAKENLVKMIKKADSENLDVLIVGRGGGSLEDLWPFNEEIVARAIYDCNTPVISAVGHEVDVTISDYVADLRAPTPTAAAELCTPSALEIEKWLKNYHIRMYNAVNNKIDSLSITLNKYKNNYILNNPLSIYEVKEQKLDNLIDKLNMMFKNDIEKNTTKIENISNKLDMLIKNNISKNENKVENVITKLELLNPLHILSKGYSVTKINDKIIKDASNVKTGDILNIKLNKGTIISEVKDVDING